jgi:flavin reductase (DIM6/NTAB) family NADH-FMN oxidoreductase RutF
MRRTTTTTTDKKGSSSSSSSSPIIRNAKTPQTEIQDNAHRYFATTVALITTDGSSGPNVMAAEWCMQVSYDPMLVSICIHDSPTLWNIKETFAFGVNIASDDQAELVNIAGGYSGTEIPKLRIPNTFEIFAGKQVPMIKKCALTCECRVVSIQDVGDHVMVIGEALTATFDETKSPLIYTRGGYRKIGSRLSSGRKIVRVSPSAFDQFKKMAQGQFVLKAAAAVVVYGETSEPRKVLCVKMGSFWTIPLAIPKRGSDYKSAIEKRLDELRSIWDDGGKVEVGNMVGIERLIIKSTSQPPSPSLSSSSSSLRANFVLFQCQYRPKKKKNGNRDEMERGWPKKEGGGGGGGEVAERWFSCRPLPRYLLLKSLLLPLLLLLEQT